MELDIDRYIGIPYCPRHMDCADLTLLVQREIFGRAIRLPGERPRPLDGASQRDLIAQYSEALAHPVVIPQSGDVVLMRDTGVMRAGHIGTYIHINHAPYVLHTSHALGASVLHRVQDLRGWGLHIESYYRWI